MSKDIILDVEKTGVDKKLEKNERWQQQAENSLLKALSKTADTAKKYKKNRTDKNYLQAVHDAIFVSAPRGAGKTVFLRNAKAIWEEPNNKNKETVRLHFCEEIDPTLLVNHDNFANVVIAHLYNTVENKFKNTCDNGLRKNDKFYQSLSRLADALGSAEYKGDELTGMDRIVSYRSGIQLERYFHDFVEECITLLDVDAFVLPIDDVDMALGRAFEVLDVVRRLLGCPYIIPLVSGDKDLYQPIIKDHFRYGERTSGERINRELISEQNSLILTDAYLTKLFPVELRVGLLLLDDIHHHLRIKDGVEPLLSVRNYYELLEATIFPLENGEEKSKDWPKPETAREMGQLCAHFPPRKLHLYKQKNRDSFWYEYRMLAEARYHGAAYLTAKAEENLSAIRASKDVAFPMRELEIFNVLKQATLLEGEWKEKNYHEELVRSAEELAIKETNQQMRFMHELGRRKYVLRSMPPLEFYIQKLSVPELNEQLENTNDPDGSIKMLVDIFCYRTYYGTSLNTVPQIFFGRGFELLATSLMLADDGGGDEEIRQKYWEDVCIKVLSTTPFHSIYSMDPTKTVEDEDEGGGNSDQEVEENGDFLGGVDSLRCKNFAKKIVEWEKNHFQVLEHYQSLGVVNLISCVFNKVFTQLHLLRFKGGRVFKNDKLTDVIKRFEYIVINSFATFLKPGAVIQQNIGRTQNLEILRNPKEFANKDPSFRGNVIGFIGAREEIVGSGGDDFSGRVKFLQAVWKHPLFDLNVGVPAISIWKNSSEISDRVRGILVKMFPKTNQIDGVDPVVAKEYISRINDRLLQDYPNTKLDDVFSKGEGKGLYKKLKLAAEK